MYILLIIIIYLSFISLGLPDAVFGSAWPSIYTEFGVPLSYAGGVSFIIAVSTIISSLVSQYFNKRFTTAKVTAFSAALTALAILGFAFSDSYWKIILWSIPYGLGAGSVDVSINNYVSKHYSSKHMNWLHAMWGVGASFGPFILGRVLISGAKWNRAYFIIAAIQMFIAIIVFSSSSLWKDSKVKKDVKNNVDDNRILSLKEILSIASVKEGMVIFFAYSALEQSAGFWASSFLFLKVGIGKELASTFGALFFFGIMLGRIFSGFISDKFTDRKMIIGGETLVFIGIVLLLINNYFSLAGLVLIGLGLAPIYPAYIHSTPKIFGKEKSSAILGVEMASAYFGICIMPPLFGIIADYIDIAWYPFYLFFILLVMSAFYELMIKKIK